MTANLLRLRTRCLGVNGIQNKYLRFNPHLTRSITSPCRLGEPEHWETFRDHLSNCIETVVSNKDCSVLPDWVTRMRKMMNYNLRESSLYAGYITEYTYKALEKPENLTEENIKKSRSLGWCVEMLQSYFIMVDDVVDGSSTRHGKPCWYTLSDVGDDVFHDSMMMHGAIYEILKVNFRNNPHYVTIMELFNEALFHTGVGQHTDIMMPRVKDYSKFTVEQYRAIVSLKSIYLSYKLSMLLGYILAGRTDETLLKKVDDISYDMGIMLQAMNDFSDCYVGEETTRKIATDIQEGKCTWLSVNALRLCSAAQRAEFVHNYAHSDPARVHRIKQLYQDLNLKQVFEQEDKELCDKIEQKANELPEIDRNLVINLLHSRNVYLL